MEIRRGIAVSPGVAIGPALVLDTEGVLITVQKVERDQVPKEIERLREALINAANAAKEREKSLAAKLGGGVAEILGAHGGFFEDPSLVGNIESSIRTHQYTAEYAVSRSIRTLVKQLDSAGRSPLAARYKADFLDLEKQLLSFLLGMKDDTMSQLTQPVIVLGRDLTPSETANLDTNFVKAMATESGGATSHTAILAGALEIPAVVGVGAFLTDVSGGDMIIVDGHQGWLIIDPDPATLAKYHEIIHRERTASGMTAITSKNVPAVTKDGERVRLLGNIEFPPEARQCVERGADGVGLYRTEFLYVNKTLDPTEEEHYHAYREVLSRLGPDKPVVIRTLDIGGDKFSAATGATVSEKNPFLGLRSVRLCLKNQPLFKTQLRAILRAAVHGDLRIMFPMVSTIMELRQCKNLLRESAEDLEEAGLPFKSDIPIGTMIEVPSAAILADVLAREVDFFSIGTNDLVQYTLAADRNNEQVADLYTASDPAVLRLIAQVAKAAQTQGIDVNVCGEMSGEALYVPFLLGLGIRQLSATPRKIPALKRVIRNVSTDFARSVAEEALKLETSREVTSYLREQLRRTLPDATDAP